MKSLNCIEDYKVFASKINQIPPDELRDVLRYLMRTDLFFLLWFGLGRKDVYHPWVFDRCREVQGDPDGVLFLWSRGHYKSTIVTYAKTIQDILATHGDDPVSKYKKELTFGIFSFTRPIAKAFLRQVKREFESNEILHALFDDIVWDNPHRDAPKWSEDDGIILKRKSNPKESTVEAWGLVDSQPTSRHFDVAVYDDVITANSVSTPDMIHKVTAAWEMSLNLGSRLNVKRYVGTRYHFNDTYKVMMDRGSVKTSLHTCTIDGTITGEPVLMTKEMIAKKRKDMGPYTFASQMLMNPVADQSQGFKQEWLRYHTGNAHEANLNVYICVDPANEKKRGSDYTAMLVIGLGSDNSYYILDMVRDRMNLTERCNTLFRLHKKYKPICIGYEKYGMQADITYIREQMNKTFYHFSIKELGGGLSKVDRIRKLIPIFENHRLFLPDACHKTDYEGITKDLVNTFIHEEYLAFPVSQHDDMLDCMARILDEDLGAIWPKTEEYVDRYSRPKEKLKGGKWA